MNTDNPPANSDLDKVLREWGTIVKEGARESASIKSSAMLPAAANSDGDANTPTATGPAPLRRVAAKNADGDGGVEDFVLGELLGKGGMGLVFRAQQAGLDRDVALKTIIPDHAADAPARRKFLAEARVTGQLDHPNIVPIYELATAPDGALFYTMKEVRGRPWSRALPKLSENDNIDILLKVADAVAFAHGKGVIHRDLKPENVMLGDYGEVLLMDWGLAAGVADGAKAERLSPANARGGTPAYMSPEMAAADAAKIGPASDIYLLGAILYEILTGLRPHHGQNVFACIFSAHQNTIQSSDRRDEIMDVAKRALATEPSKRFRDAKEFQQAIRDCREHAASRALSDEARETLKLAKRSRDYTDHARAVFGFGEALRLWPGNAAADLGLTLSRKSYAETALDRGDFDLALSQTAHMAGVESEDLRRIAEAGKAERERRRIRLKRLTRLSTVLVALLLVVGAVAYRQVSRSRARALSEAAAARKAENEKTDALTSEQRARRQAESARKEAVAAQHQAEAALTAKENAEAKERAAREEQVRLSGELAGAAEKLGLWEKTESTRASLLGVTPADAGKVGESGENSLALAIAAVDVINAPEAELENKAKALTSLSVLARHADDFSALIAAFERVEDGAAAADNRALRDKIHELTTLIRRRLPPDHARFAAREASRLPSVQPEPVFDAPPPPEEPPPAPPAPDPELENRLKQDLHDALKAVNPDYTGTAGITVRDGRIVGVDLFDRRGNAIRSCKVKNIKPLRGLPLEKLYLRHDVDDISPLKGMPLRELQLSTVSDLSLLGGMPLERLVLNPDYSRDAGKHNSSAISLEPVRNAPLVSLEIDRWPIINLKPLAGKQLNKFYFTPSKPFRHNSIKSVTAKVVLIDLSHITPQPVFNLSNLDDSILETLKIRPPTVIKNLAALRDSDIESLSIMGEDYKGKEFTAPSFAKNINKMKALKELRIGNWIISAKPAPHINVDWLAGINIDSLDLMGHCVFDPKHLRDCKIKNLTLYGTALKTFDLEKLKGHKTLETVNDKPWPE